MDPNYRYYNCNIQCPRLKCEQLDVEQRTLEPSGIMKLNGVFPAQSTTFTFTKSEIPALGTPNGSGLITLYLTNNDGYSNVSMMGFSVAGFGATGTALVYQRIGNFISVNAQMNLSSSGDTIVVTVNPSAVCQWTYEGTK